MPISLPKPATSLGRGDPNFALTGTGKGIRGIDAILEFNGFYLNDRSVVDKYRVLKIDGLADADIRDAREPNPNNHGETPFDALYGGRTIVITGRIEAHTLSKLRDMETALRQAFNDLIEKPLIIRTGNINNDVKIMCRKSAPIAMSDEQKDWTFYRDFMLTLRASNPRFVGYIGKNDNNIFGDVYNFDTNATVVRHNFIPNPGPYSTASWVGANTSMTHTPTGGPVGNANRGSIASAAVGTNAWMSQTFNLGDGSGIVEAARGNSVSLSSWFKVASGSALKSGASDMIAQIECSISGGSFSAKQILYSGVATGAWVQRNTASHPIPTTATQIRVFIYNPTTNAVDFARVMLEIGEFSNDYVDGYQFNCRWIGNENTSYSEKWSDSGLGTHWSIRTNPERLSVRGGSLVLAGPEASRQSHFVLNDFKHANDSGNVIVKFNAASANTEVGAVYGGVDDHYAMVFNWGTKKFRTWNKTAGTLNDTLQESAALTGLVDSTYYWLSVTKTKNAMSGTLYSTNPNLPSPTVVGTFSYTFTSPMSVNQGNAKEQPGLLWTKPAAQTRVDEFQYNPGTFTTSALSVVNEGNFTAQPIFKISGANYAALTNGGKAIVLNNLSTGQKMQINAAKSTTAALTASETLVIDGTNDSIYIEETGLAKDNLLDFTSDWIELIPGVNMIDIEIVSSSAGQPEVSVSYFDTWM